MLEFKSKIMNSDIAKNSIEVLNNNLDRMRRGEEFNEFKRNTLKSMLKDIEYELKVELEECYDIGEGLNIMHDIKVWREYIKEQVKLFKDVA